MALLSYLLTSGLVETTRCISGHAKQAVVEMGSPPIGLPALVKVPTPQEAARAIGAR